MRFPKVVIIVIGSGEIET